MKRIINLSLVMAMLLGFLPPTTATAAITMLWEQLPGSSTAMSSFDGNVKAADDFVLESAASIGQVEFWSSVPGPVGINVYFYANTTDDSNMPTGDPLCSDSFTSTGTTEDSAICPVGNTYCTNRHTLTLSSPCSLDTGHYWVSIYGVSESFLNWSYDSFYDGTDKAGYWNTSGTWVTSKSGFAFRLLESEETCHESVVVMNTADSGEGSLRQAIIDVCPDGTITFDASLSGATIFLTSGQLILDKDVTIDASALSNRVTVNPDNTSRVMQVNSGVTATLDSLKIIHGNVSDFGGGILNRGNLTVVNSDVSLNLSSQFGAGIYNDGGTLFVTNSTLQVNTATSQGGGIFNTASASLTVTNSTFSGNEGSSGGAIATESSTTTTITGSTLTGNQATHAMGSGGGLLNNGTMSVANSTLYTNSAPQYGGGICNYGTMDLWNSTLSGNIGHPDGYEGHGLANLEGGILYYSNIIIANSPTGYACYNEATIYQSSNSIVEEDLSGGCPAVYNADPWLSDLTDNGGPTLTMALQEGSYAIDAGNDENCSNALVGGVDQRGITRPQGVHCDIGAYELEQAATTGELKISKVFNPGDSGFTDTFAITYNCDDGTDHDGTVNLGAGESETITGVPIGTQCTVTEPTLPTAPEGWTFGTPTFSPEGGVATISEVSPAYVEVVVTNTISQDTPDVGDLTIRKVFNPGDSGFTGSFTINYDCDDGTDHDGTVTLAAGGSETISGIPTGTNCTMSENSLPTAPTGWSFESPTFDPSSGTVTISETMAEVTVSNGISRDLGELKISKVFDPLTSGFTDSFTIAYDCDDGEIHDGTVELTAGGSETISGIPTGTNCTVSEDSLPTAPTGWTFGSPTYDPESGSVTITSSTSSIMSISSIPVGAEVIITNTISRDLGELKISKVFDPLTSGFTDSFTINYDCDDGTDHDGTVTLAAGGSETISGIPTGTTCTVSEPSLPTAPTGWTFGTPTLHPADGTATISETIAEVTVTNTISRDTGELKISKVFDPGASGFAGDFTINYDCEDGTDHDGTVTLAADGSETITGIPIGTLCTVIEPILLTAPEGWTFGTPTFSPETGSITILEGTNDVTVTNTISRDLGDLTISKVFDPLNSGFDGTFAIDYDCDDGITHDGSVHLSAGGSQTINGIPTGTICTVIEDSLPTAPTGWTFGEPTYNPENGNVTITSSTSSIMSISSIPVGAEVTVTNTISRDLGELKISKVFDPLTSGFTGTFTIYYDCDDGETHDGSVDLVAGGSQTITGIPTGTTCTITEPSLSTAPTGWTFGTPTFSLDTGSVTVSELSPAYAEVIVTNTISRDLGELKISKVFDPLTSAFTGDFPISYDCDDGEAHDGTVELAAGESATISGIPTGTTCTISEDTLPTAPTGWTFGSPSFSPTNSALIQFKSPTYVQLTVTNTISLEPDILPNPLPPATVGFHYSQQLTAVGGTSPYSWSSIGLSSVPFSLISNTGMLVSDDNPLDPAIPGVITFTAIWNDSAGVEFQKELSLTVSPALAFSPETLSTGKVSEAFSQVVTISGGLAPYTITPESLPDWLSSDTDPDAGTITLTGTPTTFGSYSIQLQVVDSAGVKGAKTYNLWIGPERAFTWFPESPIQNEGVTFTPAADLDSPDMRWWRGDNPGDPCETYVTTYTNTLYVEFNESGSYQICLQYRVDSINDFAWDRQWITIADAPTFNYYFPLVQMP